MPLFCRAKAHPTSAFTLAELLIVIGIVTLLISILLPTLSKARREAAQVQCAANLRNWGQAFHMYADNNRGVIPHRGDESDNPIPYCYLYDPAYPQDECGYTDVLAPYLAQPPWRDFPNGSKPTGGVWQCPLATILPDSAYSYLPSVNGYHSYLMNEYLEADLAFMHRPTEIPKPLDPSFLRLARARTPSLTLLMFEGRLGTAYLEGPNTLGSDCFPGSDPDGGCLAFTDRHAHQTGKLGGNLMMLDGHVEWADHLWDSSFLTVNIPPRANTQWWPN